MTAKTKPTEVLQQLDGMIVMLFPTSIGLALSRKNI